MKKTKIIKGKMLNRILIQAPDWSCSTIVTSVFAAAANSPICARVESFGNTVERNAVVVKFCSLNNNKSFDEELLSTVFSSRYSPTISQTPAPGCMLNSFTSSFSKAVTNSVVVIVWLDWFPTPRVIMVTTAMTARKIRIQKPLLLRKLFFFI